MDAAVNLRVAKRSTAASNGGEDFIVTFWAQEIREAAKLRIALMIALPYLIRRHFRGNERGLDNSFVLDASASSPW